MHPRLYKVQRSSASYQVAAETLNLKGDFHCVQSLFEQPVSEGLGTILLTSVANCSSQQTDVRFEGAEKQVPLKPR